MPKAQILIVEDDRSLADVLDYNLRQDGYQTTVANDGQDGLQQGEAEAARFDRARFDAADDGRAGGLPAVAGRSRDAQHARADAHGQGGGDRRGRRLLGRHGRLRLEAV